MNKLESYIKEMDAGGIKVTSFVINLGLALISTMIALADDSSADLLLAIRGFSKKDGSEVSRIFAYRVSKPYTSLWVEPEDYRAIIDLIQPGRNSGSCGLSNSSNWEPFNLLKFISTHLPDHPVGGEEARKAIENFHAEMKNSVADRDKPYFHGFVSHVRDGKHVTAQNLAKTLVHGDYAAYRFCADHNVSTCWTSYPELARDIDTAINYINGN